MININQINGYDVDNVCKELAACVSACMETKSVECLLPLVRHLVAEIAVYLLTNKSETAEDWWIQWTT